MDMEGIGMYGFDSYVSKGLMSPESMMMMPQLEYDHYHHHRHHDDDVERNINNPSPRMFGSDELGLQTQCSAVSHESPSVNLHNNNNQRDEDEDEDEEEDEAEDLKAKIASHPCYPKLLHAYIDCHKVGAPPEMVGVLDEICSRPEKEEEDEDDDHHQHPTATLSTPTHPQLDHFMESYWQLLVKLKSDLSQPFDEAASFLTQIQTQLLSLCNDDFPVSSDEELIEIQDAETKREDRQLKEKLLRMYGSHISSLKLEFSKKKKKGKLPKEGRQTLLDWWNLHSKWPYPTETDKIALAEMTGLDQKQINNWFINQRKRHWKSPDNMHLDGIAADNLSPNFLHH